MNPEANGKGVQIWDAVHEAIQAVLTRLDAVLRAEFAELQVRSGRSSGKAFSLFSYHSYAIDSSDDAERVVVGVTLRAKGDGFVVSGDVSGESSGDVWHEVAPLSVPPDSSEIMRAAQQVAEVLQSATDAIREGLQNPSRMA
jgi:hypothetical protein